MIYTGYYYQLDKYKLLGLTPIAISGAVPTGYKGLWWKFLAPSWSIWSEYNKTKDEERYTQRYFDEILSKLTQKDLLDKLNQYDNPILLCYEKSGFCHRHLIAEWLKFVGIECKEF